MSKFKFLKEVEAADLTHKFDKFDTTRKYFRTDKNSVFSVTNFKNAIAAGLVKEIDDDTFSFKKDNSFVNSEGVTIITANSGSASGKW